jgi:eukaryotic-like serine/threonine-protein kinase
MIGQYRILDSLGRGGMGVVYRAQHVETEQLVALKTVLVPDQSLLQSIRREIHALASVWHPGVVRIVAEGLQDGLPWYAMELLDGVELLQYVTLCARRAAPLPAAHDSSSQLEAVPTPYRLWTLSLEVLADGLGQARSGTLAELSLDGVLDETPLGGPARVPAPVPAGGSPAAVSRLPAARGQLGRVLGIVRRLCGALAYLHGEGIVHRDLKPSNVLILERRAAGAEQRPVQEAGSAVPAARAPEPEELPWPVLVDFGLVSRFGGEISREALDIGEVAVGTVGYMAPEQIRGELLDARADLYSLGCILYELIAGRQPFVRPSVAEVARAHLKAMPVAPSYFVEGVSPALDALVLHLLEKRPRDRLGHADAVAAALAELGAECEEEAPAARPRPYLYRPGFAGRRESLAVLGEHTSDLRERRGAIVLVGGESGVGKTRLVMELAHKTAASRGLVLTGECSDAGGRPLEALRRPLQAIGDRCRAAGEAETDRILGARGRILALYEPELASLPGQERYPEPAELQGAAAVARVQSYVAETLEALARSEPLMLVIDDLQWADELSLGVLELFARGGRLEGVPLLVLATYRTEEIGPGLERLLRQETCSRLQLGRLDDEAVAAIVGDMLGLVPPPQHFARFLARQSEGNPFFIAEYLRTALAEGLLDRDTRGRWHISSEAEDADAEARYDRLPLPRSLRDLIVRRLGALPAPARRLAETAAVLGREAELKLLRRLRPLKE